RNQGDRRHVPTRRGRYACSCRRVESRHGRRSGRARPPPQWRHRSRVDLYLRARWRTMTYREMMDKEGYSDGTVGAVQTFFFRREEGPWTSESLSTPLGVDVVLRLPAALGPLGPDSP